MDNDTGKTDVGTAETRPPTLLITGRAAELEEDIRELHDRLTPVMGPVEESDSEIDPEQDCSPVAEKFAIMRELIADINKRLEV